LICDDGEEKGSSLDKRPVIIGHRMIVYQLCGAFSPINHRRAKPATTHPTRWRPERGLRYTWFIESNFH
jgi:hypothetical protein